MVRCSSVAARRWPGRVGLALACSALAAVLATPTVQGQEVPFEGVVVGGDAQVRAGAGPAYYLVGTVPAGTEVTVREVYYGWNRIDAPDGVFSFISKAMVDAQGDGSTGTVNQDGARVRAASIDGAAPSYRNQLSLNRGDVVAIVEEDGSFYKITPPEGASVYLSPGTVRRVELADAVRAADAAEAAEVAEAAEPATVAESTTTTVTTTTITVTDGASAGQPPSATATSAGDSEQDSGVEIAREVDLSAGDTDLTRINPDDMVPAGEPEPAPEPVAIAEPSEPAADPEPAVATATEVTTVETTRRIVTVSPDTPTADALQQIEAASDEGTVAVAVRVEPAAPPAATADDNADAAATSAGPTVQTPAESDALREVELAQLPLMDQAVEDQPIDDMIAAYRAVDTAQLTPADQELLAFRLAVLEQNRQIASVLQGVIAARRGTQTTDVVVAQDVRDPADYDAVGRLLASAVYNGNNLPLMFRLVEPSTGRTVAYVQPDAVGDARALLGRVVGIVGPMAYDPVLKLNIVEVSEVQALNPAE